MRTSPLPGLVALLLFASPAAAKSFAERRAAFEATAGELPPPGEARARPRDGGSQARRLPTCYGSEVRSAGW